MVTVGERDDILKMMISQDPEIQSALVKPSRADPAALISSWWSGHPPYSASATRNAKFEELFQQHIANANCAGVPECRMCSSLAATALGSTFTFSATSHATAADESASSASAIANDAAGAEGSQRFDNIGLATIAEQSPGSGTAAFADAPSSAVRDADCAPSSRQGSADEQNGRRSDSLQSPTIPAASLRAADGGSGNSSNKTAHQLLGLATSAARAPADAPDTSAAGSDLVTALTGELGELRAPSQLRSECPGGHIAPGRAALVTGGAAAAAVAKCGVTREKQTHMPATSAHTSPTCKKAGTASAAACATDSDTMPAVASSAPGSSPAVMRAAQLADQERLRSWVPRKPRSAAAGDVAVRNRSSVPAQRVLGFDTSRSVSPTSPQATLVQAGAANTRAAAADLPPAACSGTEAVPAMSTEAVARDVMSPMPRCAVLPQAEHDRQTLTPDAGTAGKLWGAVANASADASVNLQPQATRAHPATGAQTSQVAQTNSAGTAPSKAPHDGETNGKHQPGASGSAVADTDHEHASLLSGSTTITGVIGHSAVSFFCCSATGCRLGGPVAAHCVSLAHTHASHMVFYRKPVCTNAIVICSTLQ